MNINEKEKRIYHEIDKLREGDNNDKLFAAEVIGILCNESLADNISFDEISNIVLNVLFIIFSPFLLFYVLRRAYRQ